LKKCYKIGFNIAEGVLLRKVKKMVHAEAKVWNEAGTLIAKSSSNLAVVG
jgi:acyl-coenzyme A thioesterase PaaI-like protein